MCVMHAWEETYNTQTGIGNLVLKSAQLKGLRSSAPFESIPSHRLPPGSVFRVHSLWRSVISPNTPNSAYLSRGKSFWEYEYHTHQNKYAEEER